MKSAIPYDDSSFDHVTANGVFYCFRESEPLIKESARVLHDGGTLSFMIEEAEHNDEEFMNVENALVSKNVWEKTGLLLYCHDFYTIKTILEQYGLVVLKKLIFHAYRSPRTGKDIYFTAIVAKKQA